MKKLLLGIGFLILLSLFSTNAFAWHCEYDDDCIDSCTNGHFEKGFCDKNGHGDYESGCYWIHQPEKDYLCQSTTTTITTLPPIPPVPGQVCYIIVTVVDDDTSIPLQGATVKLDASNPQTTPCDGTVYYYYVSPVNQYHTISASKSGYESDSKQVYCKCGQTHYITLKLEKEQPTQCILDIYTYDDDCHGSLETKIYVDGKYKGENDHIAVTVDEGTHIVEAMKDCYHSESKTVSCNGGEIETVNLYLEECNDCDCDDDYEIKVYNVDTDPSSVDKGDDIEIEGKVKLIQAPSGDHDITVKWYIDGDLIKRKTYSLEEGESKVVSYTYDTDDLDNGYHTAKIKAIVDDESDSDTQEFYVKEHEYYEDYEIDVGYISLDNTHPNLGDILSGSVPIELEEAEDLPAYIDVRLYIDNHLEYTDSIKYYHLQEKTYQFSIDLDHYSEGEHIIEIKAIVDGVSDSSERDFTIESNGVYLDGNEHCLSYYRMWNKENLIPGKDSEIYVKILNCGYKTEPYVKVRLNAFGHNYDKYIGSLDPYESREITFIVQVPEDASGQTTFYGKVWNSYTQSIKQKDFVIYNSIPFIEIEDEYKAKTCRTNKITFTIRNNGHVEGIFNLTLIGDASSWISGLPESVQIKPHQKHDITLYADIPCDTEPDVYPFKIIVMNGDEIVGSSQLRVVRGFTWNWPTGWTIRGRIMSCCKIIIIILLIVLVMLWLYWKAYRIRKTPI